MSVDSILSSINQFFFPEALPSEPMTPQEPSAHWAPEKPQLTLPSDLPIESIPSYSKSSSYEYRLIAATSASRALGNEILETLSYRIQNVKEKIKEISAENMAKLREAAERANTSDFWGILKKIATSLLSALSIIFGITTLASGGSALIGGAMIASGILSLANFALSEFGAWDWISEMIAHDNEDLKRKLMMALPAAVGLIAGGIGIVGSVNGVVSGALNFAEKALIILQASVHIFSALTTLGKGVADAQLLWTQADLKLIQANLTVERENFTTTIDEIKASMAEFKSVNTKAKKAIERIAQSNIELARQV